MLILLNQLFEDYIYVFTIENNIIDYEKIFEDFDKELTKLDEVEDVDKELTKIDEVEDDDDEVENDDVVDITGSSDVVEATNKLDMLD